MAADPHTHRQTLGAKNVTNFISLSLTFKEIRSRFLKSEIQYLSISKIGEKSQTRGSNKARLKLGAIATWLPTIMCDSGREFKFFCGEIGKCL